MPQGLPGQSCPCGGFWVVQTVWHILWRFPFPEAIEGKMVSGVCSSVKPFNGSPNPCIHALNCSELPTQDLLTRGRDRVPLRIHWDADVAVERFPCLHLLDDLLRDLPGFNLFVNHVTLDDPTWELCVGPGSSGRQATSTPIR